MKKLSTPTPHPLTAAFDRGPAKYFHGRKQILRAFKKLVGRATQAKSGTTFLIQGAPGAGKSALLHECGKQAASAGWEIADIDPLALWNPDELQQSLSLKKTFKLEGGSARVGIPGIGQAEVSAGRSPHTVKTLLREGNNPLLLTLDEAQTLGKKSDLPPDQAHTAGSVLNTIHNGRLDRSVILLAAGLGTTVESFRSFGVSRFAKQCLVELGALDKEAERAVIQDWLKKHARAKGDPTAWIDSIAQETHGWPQHILAYVETALDQLDASNGVMTVDGLRVVLEEGREERSKFYKHRARGFYREQLRGIARSIADIPPGSSIDRTVIMSSLLQDYSRDEAERLFRQALYKGVLDERDNCYVIPIPSMHDWLVSNYARM